MKKHPLPYLAGLSLLLLCLAGSVRAQTTAFTYQGRLTESGAPANGRYDLIFQVFDASAAGNSIGGAVGTNGVPVTNGLFTVRLDFGATPFTGLRRWLQIQVSTNGAGSYTTLAPRQELTPAPLAVYAHTAGTVTNGGIGSAQLAASSVATASLQNSSVTGGKIASGQVVKSLNGLTDAVSLTQGPNVTINTIGNSLQISAPAGGLSLPYRGAATASPAFALTNTAAGIALLGESIGGGGRGVFGAGDYGVWGESTTGYGIYGQSTAVNGRGISGLGVYGVYGQSDNAGGRGVAGLANSSGPDSVGVIGRHNPTSNQGSLGSGEAGVYGISAGIGGANGVAGYNTAFFNGVGVYGEHTQSGNWGALGYPIRGVFGRAAGSTSVGVDGTHAPSGNYGYLGTADRGVYGKHNGSGNYGELGTANFGVYAYGTLDHYGVGADGDGPTGQAIRAVHTTSGNLGILATANEGAYGRHGPTGNYGQLGTATEGVRGENPTWQTYGYLGHDVGAVYGVDTRNGVEAFLAYDDYGDGEPYGVYAKVQDLGYPAFLQRNASGIMIGFFTLSGGFAGNISVSGATVSYNAFTGSHYSWTDETLERGTLVRLTGENHYSGCDTDTEIIYGTVRTTQANDSRCLGAHLGLLTPSKAEADDNPYLVMAAGNGDMWVTDGGNGDLEPGNYVISSDVPGCAMKDDAERFPIGHICARAAEGVNWSEIVPDKHGLKRKRISVLFESFERHSGSPALTARVQAQQLRIESLEAEVKSLRAMQSRLARLEALFDLPRSVNTVLNGGMR